MSPVHRSPRHRRFAAVLTAALLLPASAIAADGRLLATGGATQFEGSAGGGLVPWAVLSGYGTEEQNGGTAFLTRVDTGDYSLDATGVAWTFRNRVEFSYARQRFGLGELQRRLALPTGRFDAEVIGAKVRLGGDLVYTAMPQISLGVQHKRQLDFAIPGAVGARDDSGTDVYLAASKLFLGAAFDRHLLVNTTVRSTRANQAGLLGVGELQGDPLVLDDLLQQVVDDAFDAGRAAELVVGGGRLGGATKHAGEHECMQRGRANVSKGSHQKDACRER